MLLKGKPRRMQQPAIAQLVRELRQTMQLSQEKFADELGMTFATINRWENERATPSPLALKQIYTLLNQLGDQGEVLQAKYAPQELDAGRDARHD